MSDNEIKNNYEDIEVEQFRIKLRTRRLLNAIGWYSLCLNALIYYIFSYKIVFLIGLIISIGFIIIGIIYHRVNKLYICPYCGGHLLRQKCLSCGKIWLPKIK